MREETWRKPRRVGKRRNSWAKWRDRWFWRFEKAQNRPVPPDGGAVLPDGATVLRNRGAGLRDGGTVPGSGSGDLRDGVAVPRNGGPVPRDRGAVPRNGTSGPRNGGNCPRLGGTGRWNGGTVRWHGLPARRLREMNRMLFGKWRLPLSAISEILAAVKRPQKNMSTQKGKAYG